MGGNVAGGCIVVVIQLAFAIFMLAAMWKVFTKAGRPGWAALVPFYNMYIMLLIAGKPGWWLILMFIPLVNFVIWIMMLLGLAANFGKGVGFAIGLLLLPIIFYPILAFGAAEYKAAQA